MLRLSLAVASGGYSLLVARRLLVAASLPAAWALEHVVFSSGAQAWLLHGMRNLPGSGSHPFPLHWQADS